jgi:hypothetical protein
MKICSIVPFYVLITENPSETPASPKMNAIPRIDNFHIEIINLKMCKQVAS